MSQVVFQDKGQWGPSKSASPDMANLSASQTSKKIPTWFIVSIVVISIFSVIGGINLLYFQVNTFIGWSLIGVGGLSAGGSLILKTRDWINAYRSRSQGSFHHKSTYHIVSWNLGTYADYLKLSAKFECQNQKAATLEEALKTLDLQEEAGIRHGLLQQAFFELKKQPDIVCFQNTSEIAEKVLKDCLYGDYEFYSGGRKQQTSCTIAWCRSKFSQINEAHFDYGDTTVPNTIILLQDARTGDKICVGSSLFPASNEEDEAEEGSCEIDGANSQLLCNLATIDDDTINADVCIMAGGFTEMSDCSILDKNGYLYDKKDDRPTLYIPTDEVFDESKASKQDYIFAKSSSRGIKITNMFFKQWPGLDNVERPSPHLPICAKVVVG